MKAEDNASLAKPTLPDIILPGSGGGLSSQTAPAATAPTADSPTYGMDERSPSVG